MTGLTPEDLDRIASYLEGRASDLERKQVESLLDTSEAAREVLAECAVAMGLDVGADEGQEKPIPRSPWGARMRWALPLAAAVAAAVALWPSGEADMATWVTALGAPPAATPYALPLLRGGANPSSSTAVRAGVRWLDIRVAVVRGDATLVDSLAGLLMEELRPVSGSPAVIGELQSPARMTESPGEIEEALFEILGPDVRTGMSLEALRLAASRGDRALVRALLNDADVYETLDAVLESDSTWTARDLRSLEASELDLDPLNRLAESAIAALVRP